MVRLWLALVLLLAPVPLSVADHAARGAEAFVASNAYRAPTVQFDPYVGWGPSDGEGPRCRAIDEARVPPPRYRHPNVIFHGVDARIPLTPGTGQIIHDPTRCLSQAREPQTFQAGASTLVLEGAHSAYLFWDLGGSAVRPGDPWNPTRVSACRLQDATFGITPPAGLNVVRNTITNYASRERCSDLTDYFDFNGLDGETRPGTLASRAEGIPMRLYDRGVGLYEVCFHVWIVHGQGRLTLLEDYSWVWVDNLIPSSWGWTNPLTWDFGGEFGSGGLDQHCV